MSENSDEEERHQPSSGTSKLFKIQQLKHPYLLDFSAPLNQNDVKHFKSLLDCNINLPYPIEKPCEPTKFIDDFQELLSVKNKQDSYWEHCLSLYMNKKNQFKEANVIKKGVTMLPQYLVNLANDKTKSIEYESILHFADGFLDTTVLNGNLYIATAYDNSKIRIVNADNIEESFSLDFESSSPIFSIKNFRNRSKYFLIRQRLNISVVKLFLNAEQIQIAWDMENREPFTDANFNDFKKKELSFLDTLHKLQVVDYSNNKEIARYTFKKPDKIGMDAFAQFKYLDANTIAYINRDSVHLLDLRSLNTNEVQFELPLCDDLCNVITSCKNGDFYVASLHHLLRMDVSNLKATERVTHMLTSVPFMSSSVENEEYEYICLSGQNNTDSVLVKSSSSTLGVPHYVPTIEDTLKRTLLERKMHLREELDGRLSLHNLGRKLIKRDAVELYTANALGEVFKQTILDVSRYKDDLHSMDKMEEWINALPDSPRPLQVTGLANLSDAMYKLVTSFPKEDILNQLSKKSDLHDFFQNEEKHIEFSEASIGEAMASIWNDRRKLEATESVETPEPSQQKVSNWLHAMYDGNNDYEDDMDM